MNAAARPQLRNRADARALNERMWQVNIAFWETTGVLIVACECRNADCVKTVAIDPAAYEDARRRADTYVVAREHARDSEGSVHLEGSDYATVIVDAVSEDAVPRTGADEFAARHFRTLVAQLLDRLPEDGREDALRSAGEAFGRRLATEANVRPERDVAAGLQCACNAVRSLGFHAALGEVGNDVAVIATPTCPLRPLVAERPEAALLDRGMWIGLIAEAVTSLAADDLGCETQACLERGEPCLVTIRFAAG
jgi:hypothetical protein